MAGIELKGILVISSIITMIGGAVILYLTISQLSEYEDLWKFISQDAQKYAMYTLCGFGGLTVLTGVIGLIGVLKRNNCLLAIFNILAILFCAVFIGIGIAVIIFTKNQYQELKNKDCQTTDSEYDWLVKSNAFYSLAGIGFCSEACMCYVENKSDFPSGTFNAKITTTVSSFPTKFQQCDIPFIDSQYSKYLPLVELLENKLQCSGVCDPVGFYIFTDINRGPPSYTEGCKVRIQQFYEKYGQILVIVGFTTGGFFLLQILFALWLCCSKNPDDERDYYQKIYN